MIGNMILGWVWQEMRKHTHQHLNAFKHDLKALTLHQQLLMKRIKGLVNVVSHRLLCMSWTHPEEAQGNAK